MKDIKILFITNQLSYTGAPLALLSLIKLCLKEEMNVNVISLVEGPLREELETLSIKPVVWDSILRNLEQFTQLAAEFDIIIANTLPAYEAIHILDRTGIPTLWWIHEGENYFDLLDTVMPDIGKLHNNIKVAAVSEVVAEIIKQRYNYEPLILMPMIDDMKIPTKTAHTQKPMFLNIGQPSFLKGQDIFIKALYMLPSNIREGCEFVFAGVEEADNEVFNLLYNAKESFNNINIYPLMKKKELMKLINKASFTVIASRSETVSLVAAESLMLSKPCIITDTCGAAKYLTDKENSFIISANDEKGMQDAIQQAFKTFEDKNKYNEMCQNARKTYERYFSKEQFETTALSLIEKVLHNEKLISVIIPCRNVAKWLPQCFLSLVRQTIGIRNIELIFVDDASDDEGATWTLLSEMEQAYPESTLVIGLDENVRQGGARNIALRYATGKYIAFVDADDFVAENFLLKVYREAESSNADIVQFGHFLFTEGGHSVVASKLTREIITINTDKDRKKFLLEEKL